MPSAAEIRAWAEAEGLQPGERGRLREEIVAAYQAAHAGRPELREEMVLQAREACAALVDVGGKYELYRSEPIPAGAVVILDWRVR